MNFAMDVLVNCTLLLIFTWIVVKLYSYFTWFRKIRLVCGKFPGPKPHLLLGNLNKVRAGACIKELVPLVLNIFSRKLFLKNFRAHFHEALEKLFSKMKRNLAVPVSFFMIKPCKS